MDQSFGSLETLFFQKIMLYKDLVGCLEREREVLVRTDMEALWEIADEKQQIAVRIEAMQKKMTLALIEMKLADTTVGVLDHARVYRLIPRVERERFRKSHLSLLNLKSDVRKRTEENRFFVEECLDFLDELIGIFTKGGPYEDSYGKQGRLPNRPGARNLLLHKEV